VNKEAEQKSLRTIAENIEKFWLPLAIKVMGPSADLVKAGLEDAKRLRTIANALS
jgi:hypothetical protein